MLSAEILKRRTALLMLLGFLLMGCTGTAVHPSYIGTPAWSPSPTVASSSTPFFSPTPEAPVPPTPKLQPWAGPLLYPSWLLDFQQPGFPVYDLGAGQTHWIQTGDHVREILAWSPDGCEVAYRTRDENQPEDQVRIINIGTGEDKLLFTLPRWPKGSVLLKWSPTGEWVAYNIFGSASHEGLYLMRPDQGETRMLIAQKEAILVGWLEGGQEVVYETFRPTRPAPEAEGEVWEGIRQFAVVHIGSGERVAIAQYAEPLESWEQMVITNVLTLQPMQLSGLDEPREAHFVELHWTSDLKYFLILTAKGGDEALVGVNLYLLDVQRGQVHKIGAPGFKQIGFDFQSQDGSLLAFVAQYFDDRSAAEPRTYVLELTTGRVDVAEEHFTLWKPNWSPDNTMLSFVQPLDNTLDYGSYIYDLTTSRVLARLPDLFFDASPVWSGSTVGWSPRLQYGPDACEAEP